MNHQWPWREILGVGLGGAAGSLVRYAVSLWVPPVLIIPFPWAILAVNLVGCFLIGMLGQYAELNETLPAWLRIAAAAGFLGGLTTFSTFGYDTYRLATVHEWWQAGLNIVLNVVGGLLAVALGMALVRTLLE